MTGVLLKVLKAPGVALSLGIAALLALGKAFFAGRRSGREELLKEEARRDEEHIRRVLAAHLARTAADRDLDNADGLPDDKYRRD